MTLSVSQAADKCRTSSQAIFIAIKKDRLKAVKRNGRNWEIKEEDLKSYRAGLYSREHLRHNGQLVYSEANGLISVRQAAKMLNIDDNRMYYAVYKNQIKYTKKGAAYVLKVNDVIEFGKNFIGPESDG